MAVYSLKEDKCRLFLTAGVALKGSNLIHLVPESRPNDQADRKWWITDLVFNSKGLTQQKVKVAERTFAFRSLRWSNGWFVPGEATGLTRWITFTCLAIVSRCFTETQRPSNSGSKTDFDQGETLSGTRLVQGGPRHWSIRVLSDWFLASSVPVTGGGTWRTTKPHKRKMRVKMKRLFVSFNNHNSGRFLNL